jgi:hypothetical protein
MKRKLLPILSVIFLSNNVYAFDFCREFEEAIKTCRSEVQTMDMNFDAYMRRCHVKEAVFDTWAKVYVPVYDEKKKERPVVDVTTHGTPTLRFKFSRCLKEHLFLMEFDNHKKKNSKD